MRSDGWQVRTGVLASLACLAAAAGAPQAALGQQLRQIGSSSLTDSARSIAFSHDSKMLACSDPERIWVWKVTPVVGHGNLLQRPMLLDLHSPNPENNAVVFSPDDRTIACCDELGGTVQLWSLPSGRLKFRWVQHLVLTQVVFSPDGGTIAYGGGTPAENSTRCYVKDARTGTLKRTLPLQDPRAFSRDGRFLATTSEDDHTVRLWDLATGRYKWKGRHHSSFVKDLAFSPDGRWLACCAQGGTIQLWDARTGTRHSPLAGSASQANALAFSKKGALLAGAVGSSLKIWDARSGALKANIFTGAALQTVQFIANSRRVLGADGHLAYIWDYGTGRCLQRLPGVDRMIVSPDGKYAASYGQPGKQFLLWALSPDRVQ